MFSQAMMTKLVMAVGFLAGAVGAHPRTGHAGPANAKTLYFLTNNAENAVVAIPLDGSGMLSLKGSAVVKTAGAGANGISGATNQSAMPDSLFSQAALTVSDDSLFAVNPGSNTVTMFSLSSSSCAPVRLGSPVPLPAGASFPVTVAASARHRLVCVGTSGGTGGVTCAPFTPGTGISSVGFDALRPFDLQQSTPPVGPTNTVSHVLFNADESLLLATVKGNPATNKTGFLASFPIAASQGQKSIMMVAQSGTKTTPPNTAVLFGSAPIPHSDSVLVTDASFGAAVLSIDHTTTTGLVVAEKSRAVIAGQKATCWAAISPATGTGFVTDVARNLLVEIGLTDGAQTGVLGEIDLSPATSDPGLIDLAAAGTLVYALSPGNGTVGAAISVVDVKMRKLVQHVELAGVGANGNAMGLALGF
ncbi:WD40/YVTN repeat-like-containing domain protein [Echria macrotheca]|uniref:WD40/YVTN repeat-like-containing domain protein n=1 Tax=Echria macrotheca TaxID=438768 RepID=A0AAJ0F1P6_9PEZI|nr:WD40/YVTN repeat-like-containing domain protein [Echria macrotheca]